MAQQMVLLTGATPQDTADLLDLITSDWRHDEVYVRFVDAVREVSRTHQGWVSQNDVRAALCDDNGDLQVNPRHYSPCWRQAHKDGLLVHRNEPGWWDVNTSKRRGNGGKWQRLYRWTGGAF